MSPINPDRTKPWNNLPLLPPVENQFQNVEVYEKLVKARASLAELKGRAAVIPNQTMLINTISLQEAKASSEIENIFTTEEELYKAFSKANPESVKGPAKEVLRYREALWRGFNELRKKERFDLDYVINVFREIKDTNQGIRHHSIPTLIRKGGDSIGSGEIVYTPPRGEGILEEKLNNLLDFLNDDEKYNYDPLLKMAIAHYQFEAIHPFSDGNGRTGRIINIHYLTKKGLLDLPIFYLSGYIIRNKNEYYAYLGGVSQRGNWKDWILYMLNAVEITAKNTLALVNDIKALEEAIDKRIYNEARQVYSERLITSIFSQPYCTVNSLVEFKVGAEKTVRKRLNKLAEMGILEKKEEQGHHFYINTELFNLLSAQ